MDRFYRFCLTAVVWFGFEGVLYAEPIYLQPGQCIVVGSQQVCAMKPDGIQAPETRTEYACRYGLFKGSEVADLKSYELVQILIKPDGSTSEVSLKNFGLNGKEACDQEVDKRKASK